MPKEVKKSPNVQYTGRSKFKYLTNNGTTYSVSFKFNTITSNTITYIVKLFKNISPKKVVFIKEFSFNSTNVNDNKIEQLISQISRKDYSNLPDKPAFFNDEVGKQILLQNKNANSVTATPITSTYPPGPQTGLQISQNGIIYITNATNTNSSATITGNTLTTSGSSVTIPDTIEDQYGFLYPVTAIGQNAFLNCTVLSNISIPNSITSIGQSAFEGCNKLVNVEMIFLLPTSIISIGASAFQGCELLNTMTLPYSNTAIGSDAFQGCNTLQNIFSYTNNLFTNKKFGTLYDFFFPYGKNGYYVIIM